MKFKETEKDLQKACNDYLRLVLPPKRGWWEHFQEAPGNIGGRKGIPDLIGFINTVKGNKKWTAIGFPFACELKRKGFKPTARQQAYMEHLKKCGFIVAWFDNFEDLKVWIDELLCL